VGRTKNRSSRDFRTRSTFDFFNSIGAKRTFGKFAMSAKFHQRKSGFGFAVMGSQRNGGLCRQQEESKCLLKVEADRFVVVT
jgi:hypothetical protein